MRHRSFQPDASADETLGSDGPKTRVRGRRSCAIAIRRCRRTSCSFTPRDRRAIPLSGVARIDWLVAGTESGGRDLRAPADAERVSGIPFAGLEARAAADGASPRLIWSTESHQGLWGWAIFREEVLADGRIARTGPEIVPSSESAAESFRYAFVDQTASPGTFYRYTVWAVTDEGLLARAFSATLKTAE